VSGWSFTLSAVAVLNLAVVQIRRARITPLGITAYTFGFLSSVGAGSSGLLTLAVADRTGPAAVGGAALVTAAPALAVAIPAALAAEVAWPWCTRRAWSPA
jgi:hypothetical protein